jgi:hypothetical protein
MGRIFLLFLLLAASTVSGLTSKDFFEDNIGLVLVPVDQDPSPPSEEFSRAKRAVENASRRNEDKKYHRLAHSVHVQSDIRYRYEESIPLKNN